MKAFMLDTETERLLGEGKAAARNGDKNAARTLLTQVVERDPHNEQAWMWLSGVVAEPEEQQICLENVLVINPHNTKARKGLDFISVKTGMAPNVPPLAIAEMDLGNPSEYTSPLGTSPLSDNGLHEETPTLPGDAPFSFSSERDSTSTLPWLQADDYTDAPAVAQTPMLPQDAANGTGEPWAASSQGNGAEKKFDFFDMPDVDAMPPWVQPEPSGENITGDAQNYGGDGGSTPGGEALPAYAAKAEGISVPADDHLDGVNFDAAPFSHEMPGGGGFDFPAYAGQATPQGMAPAGEMELPEWTMSGVLPSGGEWDAAQGNEFTGASGMGDMPAPFDPFSPPGGSSMGPMGPSFDAQLPSPGDLPGYDGGGADQAQPWYLQQAVGGNSGSLSAIAMPNQGMPVNDNPQQTSRGKKEPAATIDCPNCHEKATDTALACPNCRYSFFVNCPNCHELVDTSDARQNTSEPCPYCKAKIDRMAMGLEGTDGAMPYKSESMAGVRGNFPAMKDFATATTGKQGLSFGWLVDVIWLMVIVMTVWALTQLPTWLHLTGQY
jgi:hypothetical protein